MKKIIWATCTKCGRDYPGGAGVFGPVDYCGNCGGELHVEYMESEADED